jgi:hypothetical protein
MLIDNSVIAAIAGGVTGLITTATASIVAIGNSQGIRIWLEQRGIIKKSQLRLEAELIEKVKEDLRIQRLETEAVRLNYEKKLSDINVGMALMSKEVLKLATRATRAQTLASQLESRQRENILRIEALESERAKLFEANLQLLQELNKRKISD